MVIIEQSSSLEACGIGCNPLSAPGRMYCRFKVDFEKLKGFHKTFSLFLPPNCHQQLIVACCTCHWPDICWLLTMILLLLPICPCPCCCHHFIIINAIIVAIIVVVIIIIDTIAIRILSAGATTIFAAIVPFAMVLIVC